MEDTKTTTENNDVKASDAPARTFSPRGKGGPRNFDRGGRKRMPEKREKPEFDQKILSVRRVTRVVSGGRRFSFSVAIVLGDRKGSVGLGLGKSADTTLAINKAVAAAKKSMFRIETTKEMSIRHDITGKFKASRVMLMPNKGKGLVVGGAIRDILLLAGLKNVSGKIYSRSKTHLNNAKACMEALKSIKKAKAAKA